MEFWRGRTACGRRLIGGARLQPVFHFYELPGLIICRNETGEEESSQVVPEEQT